MSVRDRYVYAIEEKYGRMIYVGVGKGNRWAHHLSQARRGIVGKCNPAKGQYLIHCLAAGIELEIYKIAENLSIDEACKLEIEIIDLLGRRDLGTGPLLNGCDGGNGVKNLAQSTRAKIAESARKQNSARCEWRLPVRQRLARRWGWRLESACHRQRLARGVPHWGGETWDAMPRPKLGQR